jgi:DNA-binding PadR family transcriptional regulator
MILGLLKDKPSYGYEIIRDLEERFGGLYTPSAGTVYPTLQMLEEMGYVTSASTDSRKVYTITPEGVRYLEEQKGQVEDVRERMSGWWDRRSNLSDVQDVLGMLHDMRKMLKHSRRTIDPAMLQKIRAAVERAYREMESLLNG